VQSLSLLDVWLRLDPDVEPDLDVKLDLATDMDMRQWVFR